MTEALGRHRRRLGLWLGAGLLCLILGVFQGIRHHDFADLDDIGGIKLNRELQVASAAEAVRNAWARPLLSNWMPLTAHSHQLDRWLYGEDAGGHLTTNLMLHAFASLLLFGALLSLTGAIWPSAFVAAVFAVHPLHVETVAWVSERKGVLSGVFFMATLWLYARYARRPGPARYGAVVAGLVCALLSKPTTVTLPFVLLLLDVWPLRRFGWSAVREKGPMIVLIGVASIVTYLVQEDTGAMQHAAKFGFGERLQNAIGAYAVYLRQTFWPVGLAAFYPFPPGGPGAATVASGAVVLACGTGLALVCYRKRAYVTVGWLWFAGMLVPMLGLVQVGEQAHADRYMYLPLVGLAIAIAWAAADLAVQRRAIHAIGAAAGLSVVGLALVSEQQVSHWRDGRALWGRVLEFNPGSPKALTAIASIHARVHEFEEAEAAYAAAYASDPDYSRFALRIYHTAKAHHLRGRGDEAGAIESQRLAAHYDPDFARAHLGLGLALLQAGQRDEARASLTRARTLEPGNLRTLRALARDAEFRRAFAEAIALRREILERAPDRLSNRNNLAWLLATAPDPADRRPREALELARALIETQAEPSANLLDTLAAAEAAAGNYDMAASVAKRAADLAGEAGQDALAAEIANRETRYRRQRPYHETPP